jgi:arylsulfatase
LPRTGQPVRRLDPVSEGQQATYTYNFLGFQRFTIAAQPPVSVWKASIRYEFAYDGGGVDAIFVNGKKVAEGRIEHSQPIVFSTDERADAGEDGETTVAEDYGIRAPYKCTGKIDKVIIVLKEMKQAEKAEENKLLAEAAHKKALSA